MSTAADDNAAIAGQPLNTEGQQIPMVDYLDRIVSDSEKIANVLGSLQVLVRNMQDHVPDVCEDDLSCLMASTVLMEKDARGIASMANNARALLVQAAQSQQEKNWVNNHLGEIESIAWTINSLADTLIAINEMNQDSDIEPHFKLEIGQKGAASVGYAIQHLAEKIVGHREKLDDTLDGTAMAEYKAGEAWEQKLRVAAAARSRTGQAKELTEREQRLIEQMRLYMPGIEWDKLEKKLEEQEQRFKESQRQ